MATTSSSPVTHVLHRFLRPSPQPLLSFSVRPICTATAITSTNARKAFLSNYRNSLFDKPTTVDSLLFSFSFCTSSINCPPKASAYSLSLEQETEEEDEKENSGLYVEDDFDGEISEKDIEEGVNVEDTDTEVESETLELEDNGGTFKEGAKKDGVKLPTLTVKEKKELASYAHGLGKKLKCQLVGKSGVTENVVSSFLETLEANELLKIKVHRTCPGELEDVVQQLEEATGSVVVGQIGRTVIVYRPSLTKLKAEEKKKQARRIYTRRDEKFKAVSLGSRQEARVSRRGRRGSSRITTA
ncbi:hypothetical protein K2173_002429 [Erythroxylum novogranatense]|uniref:CRM domain-containing protein n=1 Tax=Erythroxylum novogranatense TaxID=1862640 RepID=A0AAV8TB39_9ROSI|nr:hypothetical protein K2173_002429 [Erythroxylum novogranatense]